MSLETAKQWLAEAQLHYGIGYSDWYSVHEQYVLAACYVVARFT
jgi:hypothetical protein